MTKVNITESMEGKWRKLHIVLYSIFLFILLFVILVGVLSRFTPLIIAVMFPAMGVTGALTYEIVQYVRLIKHVEDYEVYEVLLDRPVTSFLNRGNVYFMVGFKLKCGTTIMRKTKPIWSDFPLSLFQAWEYTNAMVDVAYDENRDRMVVLGIPGQRW